MANKQSKEDTIYLLENYIYLYHLNKFCILPSMPDSISDNMPSNFVPTNALARSAPVQSYSNSGPRSIQFTFDLHRDIMEDLNKDISDLKDDIAEDIQNKDYVDILLNYLQACALPRYNVYKTGSKAVDPPQVAIRMGNDIFIRGVVSSGVSVTYKKPILDNGKYAWVQVTITVTEVDPYDAPTVAMVGGFRGVTSTFKRGIYTDDSDSTAYSKQEFTTNVTSTTNSTTVNSINIPQKKVPDHNSLYILDNSQNTKKLVGLKYEEDNSINKMNYDWLYSGQGFGIYGYRPSTMAHSTDRYFSGQGFGITEDWGMDSSPLSKSYGGSSSGSGAGRSW